MEGVTESLLRVCRELRLLLWLWRCCWMADDRLAPVDPVDALAPRSTRYSTRKKSEEGMEDVDSCALGLLGQCFVFGIRFGGWWLFVIICG